MVSVSSTEWFQAKPQPRTTDSYPGSPCLKVLVTRRGPWQTLTAWLPNNPKILDYFVTWPFLAMIHRGEQRRKKNKITINKIFTNTSLNQSKLFKIVFIELNVYVLNNAFDNVTLYQIFI